jgi:Uma2 family endonuclease
VIRGFLYVTPPPVYYHQVVVSEINHLLDSYVRQNRLGRVLNAPVGVRLPRGVGDPVQPDLVYLRSDNLPLLDAPYVDRVPDLLVEVLSPSTRQIDQRDKFSAYQAAGVPEYWLVDPRSRTIVIYRLKDGAYVELDRGGLGDSVRSAVLPGFSVEVAEVFPQ